MRSTKDVPQPWLESLFRPVMWASPSSKATLHFVTTGSVGSRATTMPLPRIHDCPLGWLP